jgi:hypothetical protein
MTFSELDLKVLNEVMAEWEENDDRCSECPELDHCPGAHCDVESFPECSVGEMVLGEDHFSWI